MAITGCGDPTECDMCGADLYSFELEFGICGNCEADLEDYDDDY